MPVQKSRLLSSEGVASKRNFFEGSAPSKAEPAALRKVRQELRRAGASQRVLGWGRHRLWGKPSPRRIPGSAWQAAAGIGGSWVPGLGLGTGTAPALCGFLPSAGI